MKTRIFGLHHFRPSMPAARRLFHDPSQAGKSLPLTAPYSTRKAPMAMAFTAARTSRYYHRLQKAQQAFQEYEGRR